MKATTKDLVGPPRDTDFVIYLQFQAYYQVLYEHPALGADEVRAVCCLNPEPGYEIWKCV
jgi:hypothetical protein